MYFSLKAFLTGAIFIHCLIQSVRSQFEEDELIFDAGELGRLKGKAATTLVTKRPFIEFLGIPYAEPTTTDNRFLPPQNVTLPLSPIDANGIFQATKYGPCCPQHNRNPICSLLNPRNEDCLHLNIYTPVSQETMEDPLPVIVFIHGGSFTMGSSHVYNGDRFLEKDVVVVNMNYRLGVLGFFCLNTDEAPGNAALYDMVEALRFIKNYIHHFGGDPSRITLMGQSAGSAAVTHLMISPMIKDEQLFHRAIAMSGTALNDWATTSPDAAQKASLEVAQLAGCYNPSNGYDPAQVIDCMRKTPDTDLIAQLEAYQVEENKQGRLGLGPVTPVIQIAGEEPRFLEERPQAILERNEQANIPLMMGTTRHDGSFVLATEYNKFIKANGYEEDEKFLRSKLIPTLLQALGLQDPTGAVYDALAGLYLGMDIKNSGNFTLMIPGLTDLHSVFFFKAAAHTTLSLHSRIQSQSYWYNFDYSGRYSLFSTLVSTSGNPVRGGVGHADDLIYLFSILLSNNLIGDDLAVCNRMLDYWVNFAYTGNPSIGEGNEGEGIKEVWPAYSEASPSFAVIKTTDEFIVGLPSDHWVGLTQELFPEFSESTTTTEHTSSPTTDPQTTTPPATDPQTTNPPTNDPQTTTPPATDPQTTTPPATDPQTTTPPATDPQTTNPTTTTSVITEAFTEETSTEDMPDDATEASLRSTSSVLLILVSIFIIHTNN